MSQPPDDIFLGSGLKAAVSFIHLSAIKSSLLDDGWQLSYYPIKDVFLPEFIVSDSLN